MTNEERQIESERLDNMSLLESVEDTLAKLTALRDKLKEEFARVPQPSRWRGQLVIQGPTSWILHLQRRKNKNGEWDLAADPASVARAFRVDGEWHRYGSQWQVGYSQGLPFITVMIHGAELERKSPEVVQL